MPPFSARRPIFALIAQEPPDFRHSGAFGAIFP
jgi:hypothetical protein